jgi:hypothetical protein
VIALPLSAGAAVLEVVPDVAPVVDEPGLDVVGGAAFCSGVPAPGDPCSGFPGVAGEVPGVCGVVLGVCGAVAGVDDCDPAVCPLG